MKKSRITFTIIFSLLSFLIIAFIFGNSLKTADESMETSNIFTDILNNFCSFFGFSPNYETLSFFIRKTGHLLEYLILSVSLSNSLLSIFLSKKAIYFAPVIALLTAICDEFVMQRATLERSPEWRDVGIDFIGALIGAGLILLFSGYILRKIKKENENE